MDNLLETYQKTQQSELEIRIKDVALSTIEGILLDMEKNYTVEHVTFIDSIDYSAGHVKTGMRSIIQDGKAIKKEGIYKKRIQKVMGSSVIAQYSVDLSEERTIPISEVASNPTVILLKHRYSYLLPKHKDWRVDISIVRKAELTGEGIRQSVKSFFTDIKSMQDLFIEVRKKKFNFEYQLEIEHIGTNHKVTQKEIEDVVALPFKLADANVEKKIKFKEKQIKAL